MPTFTPSPCRTCTHWLRLANGNEDCDLGRLLRQPRCSGYEREPGSDDFLDDDYLFRVVEN